ncbi:MAG: hypothetical protein JXA09_15110 [Anaerolineae bacterium]|nr:hypothetical protein [Anaerolineae bacterium]
MTLEHYCPALDQPARYQIRLWGELDRDWAAWFDDGRRVCAIVVEPGNGVTTVTGVIADQPALYGLLAKMRDLSLTLLSVYRLENDPAAP